MSSQLRILNAKERKEFAQLLHDQFGFTGELDGAILRNDKREKYFLFSKSLAQFDTSALLIDAMGLYIAAHMKNKLRLTIEGSEIIGPHAAKNTIELTPEEAQAWMAGANIPLDIISADVETIPDGTFLIVRCGTDWLGCGRKADAFLYNYVPKTRHVHASFGAETAETENDEEAATHDVDE